MPSRWLTQTDFSTGELDPRLFGRVDIERRGSGVARARNVLLEVSGAASRRPGWRYVRNFPTRVRLIPWRHRDGDVLLTIRDDGAVVVYDADGDTQVGFMSTGPWSTSAQLRLSNWAQDAREMAIVYGGGAGSTGLQVRRIRKHPITGWELSVWPFNPAPKAAFQDEGVTLTPSGTTGSITLTTSAPYWITGGSGHGGNTAVFYKGNQVNVTSVSSSTVATGTVIDTLPDTAGSDDWNERAFSIPRGFPAAAAFHQGRLFLAGTAARPDFVWASRSGDPFDFGFGVDDDDPFVFRVAAEEGVAFRQLRSQGPLVLLANGAEFIIGEQPVTPTNISVQRQSSQGCSQVRVGETTGALMFVREDRSGGGEQPLILFAWDELSQQYVPTDISVLGQHLIDSPIDMVVQRGGPGDANNRAWVLNLDGSIVVVHVPRRDRPGITLLSGPINPYSIAELGGRIFAAAQHNGAHRLFRMF